jgi:cytoskeleton protein RodZ
MTEQQMPELSEDMELVGPGLLLKEARIAMKLSVEDVASQLNFTVSMVKNIEADLYNEKLPATYTRGYLKNYAKLVGVPVEEVLASYEMLGIANSQRAEMQSFSKKTKREAENNRLMWITYFIVFVLIASTIIWWFQQSQLASTPSQVVSKPQVKNTAITDKKVSTVTTSTEQLSSTTVANEKSPLSAESSSSDVVLNEQTSVNSEAELTTEDAVELPTASSDENDNINETTAEPTVKLLDADVSSKNNVTEQYVKVVFTFSGDCWVNIYDATGERVAWGVKKSGYVMTIEGVPPFNVTLGKPDLVSIVYNDEAVDTSQFKAGNIAKFTLPLQP